MILDDIKARLPLVGIVAFSGCSVNALANLFIENARHDTWLFWAAAVLVELTTAWLVWSSVETLRKVTKSNISKQDRKFYGIILALFVALSIPSLALSIIANANEFGGDPLLSGVFPLLSVACAAGAALPETVQKREQQRVEEKAEERKQRAESRQRRAEERKLRAEYGKTALQILRLLEAEPGISQAEIGQRLGRKRQTVSYHVQKMTENNVIKGGNGQGYKVLVDLP